MYGPAGVERQKIIKNSIRSAIENIVPIFFFGDLFIYQQPECLLDWEYQELLGMTKEQ